MSKELEYEINNFANLLHKDCMNLMECLKKQSEDNKPILYLGKHYEKVILPYEEYKKMCNRLEAIEKGKNTDIIDNYMAFKNDNANPSEALECLERIGAEKLARGELIRNDNKLEPYIATIKQALLKAEEPKQYVDELKLVEKKLKALDLLMQELDCKDFAELRKYARCGYEKLNKQYLKWDDLEFSYGIKTQKVRMGDTLYKIAYVCYDNTKEVQLLSEDEKLLYFNFVGKYKDNVQLFNDLHLERVEE